MKSHLDRQLPASMEAEMSVIGCILHDPNGAGLMMRERLTPQDFYYAANVVAVRELFAMIDGDQSIDLVTVGSKLRAAGQIEAIGGEAYLLDCMARMPTVTNADRYIEIVLDKRIRRQAISAAYQLTEAAFDSQEDAPVIVATASQSISALCESKGVGPEKTGVILKRVINNLEEHWASERKFSGLATGIEDLDSVFCGLKPGEICIIAGFPGEGKSALANNIANLMAAKETPGLFHNVEMIGDEQVQRTLASEASVDLVHYRPSTSGEHAMKQITDATVAMYNRELWISDGAGRTSTQIVAESRRQQQRHGCAFVVVDFLQDIRWPHGCDNENNALTRIMADFKAGAMTMRVPWIVLSQFNRDPANKQRRPRMQDLRGSGSIEQSAHKIALISRITKDDRGDLPEFRGLSDDQFEELSMIDVVKNRAGKVDKVLLRFERRFTRFGPPIFERNP